MAFSNSPITIGALQMNVIDANGVKWNVTGLKGWGSPDPTLQLLQRPRARGAIGGDSYDAARVLTITVMIVAPTPALLSSSEDALYAAVSLGPTLLSVSESGRVRSMLVRKQAAVDPTRLNNCMSVNVIQVVAEDPRKFDAALTGSTSLAATSGGLTVPFTVPFTISSVVGSGLISLTNPGTQSGPVIARIDGPTHSPVITHVGPSGLASVFAMNLNLVAGEYLLIDMEKKSVLGNGVAPRRGYVSSGNFANFDPGVNTWAFTAGSFDAGALLTITATPAW